MDAQDFLRRTHVVVTAASRTIALDLLAHQLELPRASCVAHYSVLAGEVTRLADENGVLTLDDAAGLTVADIRRLLEDVTEAVDPSALMEAVRTGACELVDFTTAIEEDEFYSGVDVVIGHVVAGLVVDRPSLVAQIREGMFRRGAALVVGPSGVGKSALLWLTVHDTRHLATWYRVRRLTQDDVSAIVRLVKGFRPGTSPVGFVIDNVGREGRSGFDRLVEEFRELPEALIVGACRQEDLFVVRTAPSVSQVRPTLEEELAQRIWRELRSRNATQWSEWREPYQLSEGLLLEYGHILTQGSHLTETIRAQVEARVRDRRALELDVLALVSTADTFGAEIETRVLTNAVAASEAALKEALYRLVDEHLVRHREGRLGGLHELRSKHIMTAVHDVPPPSIDDSVTRVILLADARALQAFLPRVLLAAAVYESVATEALATRIATQADPEVVATALHALRLVSFQRLAERWRGIFAEEGVAPTDAGLVAFLVLHGESADIFPEPIQRAVGRAQTLDFDDPRPGFVAKVGEHLQDALAAVGDVDSAALTLAALGEVGSHISIDAGALADLVEDAPLGDVRLLLEAAYGADPGIAAEVATHLGGPDQLLRRLEREQAWVRNPRVGQDEHGRRTVEAEYAFVAESVQQDPHGAVVELARYIAAFVPTADVAVARAVDATGSVAGFGGVPLADKAIERANLPSRVDVAWNRARARAAISAVAASTVTEHASGARDLVWQSAEFVRRFGDVWARGRTPNQPLIDAAVALAEAANALSPPPIAIETVGPLDEGDLPMNDPACFLARMIANNLFVNLFQGENVAPLIPQLLKQVDALVGLEHWVVLDDRPVAELSQLRQSLSDLHAVQFERAKGAAGTDAILAGAGKGGLKVAGEVARERATQRMQRVARAMTAELAAAGFRATTCSRPGEPDSYRWPNEDLLILVDVGSIVEWHRDLPQLIDICREHLSDQLWFFMAPVRDDRIVGSFGVKSIEHVFPTEEVRDWAEPPVNFLDERLGDAVRGFFGALQEASGVLCSARGLALHPVEAAALEDAVSRTRRSLDLAEEFIQTMIEHDVAIEVRAILLQFNQLLEDERVAFDARELVEEPVAVSLLDGLNGNENEVFLAFVGTMNACVELDVEPSGARVRLEA